ncbi:hypothetical protein CROQUDRAFT_673785 [Cronartium quercuum f. sp. fusiforme G11]|uniref:Uncharacterized protein n=1 Tax=Cronartium quercuum f. sp. fusiforme G11 TaxID=708437 RepID=A0A9P6ND48_9BASI|nr:hypothetical protein CROQUDRAFT_673785 [Cronartium quercuum f. sp. fusiforme G11]
MSCACISRRKKPVHATSPFPEVSKPLEASPILKSSRTTLLFRLENAFLNPDPPSERKDVLGGTSETPGVRCITTHTGAPGLAVQFPSPLRPKSILVYDRFSPRSPPVLDEPKPTEAHLSVKRGTRQSFFGMLSLSNVRKSMMPAAQVRDNRGNYITTPNPVRHSQYAPVADVEQLVSQPTIFSEPTPRKGATQFSHNAILLPPPSVRPARLRSSLATPADTHISRSLRQRYVDYQTPPPTPPPTLPLPPLPSPALVKARNPPLNGFQRAHAVSNHSRSASSISSGPSSFEHHSENSVTTTKTSIPSSDRRNMSCEVLRLSSLYE